MRLWPLKAMCGRLWLLKTPSVAEIQGFRSGSGDGYGMPQSALDRIGSLRRQPSKCARQNDSSSERFPAVILGTITLLLHRIYRGEKIAPGEPQTSVQRPDAYRGSVSWGWSGIQVYNSKEAGRRDGPRAAAWSGRLFPACHYQGPRTRKAPEQSRGQSTEKRVEIHCRRIWWGCQSRPGGISHKLAALPTSTSCSATGPGRTRPPGPVVLPSGCQ